MATNSTTIDISEIFREVLSDSEIRLIPTDRGGIDPNGVELSIDLLSSVDLPNHGCQTCTTITCLHPSNIPTGIFEFQHSIGANEADSIRKGIEQWLQLDYTVLNNSFQSSPQESLVMEMEFDNQKRRVVLGPVFHLSESESLPESEGQHPGSCACCLFTNTFQAFESQLKQSSDYFGILLFAMRNDDGSVQADCRINGEDYAIGEQALMAYAKTWPGQGFDSRKQYMVIQQADQAES